MISPYGVFISYQVNVDANGRTSLATLRTSRRLQLTRPDGNKMTIGWRQFNTWTRTSGKAAVGYTTDAGITWHFPGVSGKQRFPQRPGNRLR